jgi:xylono-1,5-lactonase
MTDVRVIARDTHDILGEGPLWSARDNAVYWVDILAPALHRLSLDTHVVHSWPMPEKIGWVIERQTAPGFIAGFQSGFAALTLEPFAIVPIANPEPHLPDNRMNDAKADAQGCIWAGTMDVGARLKTGSFYRLDINRQVTRVDQDYTIANGPTFSLDQRHIYHTDSARGLVYRFRIEDDGTLSDKKIFITFEAAWGKPDGMTTDAEGCLWIAHWGTGRVSRFDGDGKMMRSLHLPASQITSCVFAGDALDRMFVTSAADGLPHEAHAGALFEVDPGVCGLAPGKFGG